MKLEKQRQMKAKKRRHNQKSFGKIMFFIVLGLFMIFVGRFFYIGILHRVKGNNLTADAQTRYKDEKVIPAKRGTIFDGDNQPIAEDVVTYNIGLSLPKKGEKLTNATRKNFVLPDNQDEVADKLGKILKVAPKTIKKSLAFGRKHHLEQVEIGNQGRNLSIETKYQIQKQHLPGVVFTNNINRLYPDGIFASHLIGLARNPNNKKNSKMAGICGVEAQYNDLLTGKDGLSILYHDNYMNKITSAKDHSEPALNGDDVYTTINPRLETYLETLMTKAQNKFEPTNINAVLLNAHNGQIIAAAQRPTFNPRTGQGLGQMWRDTLLNETYEPGSTMKVFTVAAAMSTHHFNPNAYYKSGSYTLDGVTIHDWDRQGWGTITYRKGFYLSSNVAMANLEQQMGGTAWLSYIKRFGLLKKPHLGLGPESAGAIQYKYPIDQLNTSYGQGIDVTVMQMLQGFTAIANNGEMLKPQLIRKIVNPNTGKVVYRFKKEIVGHPVSADVAARVRDLMRYVITAKQGTGRMYKIPGYDIAAKTGTAQIANPKGGGYLNGLKNYVYSVVAMAPASHPKYILYITMKQPNPERGNVEACNTIIFNPFFKRVLDEDPETSILKKKATTFTVDDYVGQPTNTVVSQLKQHHMKAVVLGNGLKIIGQAPKPNDKILIKDKLLLKTNGEILMPDLTGWSRADVSRLANLLGEGIDINGSGYVISQNIAPNQPITKKKHLAVDLD